MKPEDIERMNAFFETNHYDVEPEDPLASEAAGQDPDDTPAAAGVMYVADEDQTILLCRRTDADAFWAFPAGTIEMGESPIECAAREFREETQQDCPDLDADQSVTYTDREGVEFTCFVATGPKFTPRLDREHSAFAWASVKFMPTPIHPGVVQALLAFSDVGD